MSILLALLPLLVCAPEAPRRGADGLRAEVQAFVDSLARAAQARQTEEYLEHFDLEEMLDAALGLLDGDAQRMADHQASRLSFLRGMRAGLVDEIGVYDGMRIDVLRGELIDGGPRASCLVRMRSDSGAVVRGRFWVRKDDESWRLYDSEDLLTGLRISASMASTVAFFVAEGQTAWTRAWMRMIDAMRRLGEGDHLEQAAEVLEEIAEVEFPPGLERIRRVLVASVSLGRGEIERASQGLASLEGEDLPLVDLLQATIHNLRGEHAAALERARRFVAAVGDDDEGRLQEGLALVGLGRPAQALTAFGQGLDEAPGNDELLVAIGSLDGAGARAELARRFAAAPRPAQIFEDVIVELLDEDHLEAAEVLVASLRELAPGDPNADYYGAECLARRGRHRDAAEMLRGTLARVEDSDEYEYYAYAFAQQCVAAGIALDAYRELEDFEEVVDWLADLLEEAGDAIGLQSLVNEHERQAPDDPLLSWLRARALVLDGQRDAAEEAFARAMDGELDDEDYERARFGRIANLLDAGRWEDAYARVPPLEETFDDVAWWLSERGEAEPLAELVAAHRAQGTRLEDAWLAWWDAEILWLRGNHDALLAHLDEQREAILADGELWRLYLWEDRACRSLVRLGRHGEATELALAIDDRDDDPLYTTIAHAAAGRYRLAGLDLVRLIENGWSPERIHADPDLGPLLRTEAAASLRAIAPPP